MLQGIFIIFLFQLIGESVQQFFALAIPGPVIGLVLLLLVLLLSDRLDGLSRLRSDLGASANGLLGHLPLLFVPIGVGVVMHISALEGQLLAVLAILFVGTVTSIGMTAWLMQRLERRAPSND